MRTLHRHKINHNPVASSFKGVEYLPVDDSPKVMRKRKVTDPNTPVCPVHNVAYSIAHNNRPQFKGYDAHGNKIIEPYGYKIYRCYACKREGRKFSFPGWLIDKVTKK